MKKLFNMTNPFWSFMGKLLDVIALHVFWIVCSLPVVTIGPATVALYYTLMKEARDEGGAYFRMYFRAFVENLKKGIPLGLIFLIGMGGLIFSAYFNYMQYVNTGAYYWDVLKYVSILIGVIWFGVFEYAFPLMARFENTVLKTLELGFFLSLKHIGWTIIMTALFVGFYFLVLWFGYALAILLILGYGFVVFLDSYILNYIFKPYVDEQEEEAEKLRAEEAESLNEEPEKAEE